MTRRVVEVGFGWSRDEASPLSVAIRYLTRPQIAPRPLADWSHMFLVFMFDDGSAVIHEALRSEGWRSKPLDKLGTWMAKDPQRRHATLRWLPLAPGQAEAVYKASQAWLGRKSYAMRQIAAFAVAESLLGRWLGLSVKSGPGRVICSEGACRLVGEVAPEWDLRETKDQSWDAVSPQSAWRRYNALRREF